MGKNLVKICLLMILLSSLFLINFYNSNDKVSLINYANAQDDSKVNSDDYSPTITDDEDDEDEFQSSFRNPFIDFRPQKEDEKEDEEEDDDDIKFEDDIWRDIPFKLQGIISYESEDIALLFSSDNSQVIKAGDTVNNYRITGIYDNFIEITRNQESMYMEVGGGLKEIEE